jgi:hypothetical protein
MPRYGQDRVTNSHRCFVLATTPHQAPILCPEIRTAHATGGLFGFDQSGSQPAVSAANFAT